MQIVFCTSIIYIIYLLHVHQAKKIMKPTFNPYCTTRDKCKAACTCEVYPDCLLLMMDESIRGSILFYHNQIRDIQTNAEPQPAGMTLLQYDMELEEISICWAARCADEYSECFLTSRFSETSQSVIQLILEEGQQPNVFLWMQVMNDWLGQVRSLSAETIQSLPAGEEGEKLHNYVQLMSDRILAVGCAWSLLGNVLTLVCTYGPRGPLQGEPIYKTGYVCSLCPGGYACDYTKPFEQLCKLRIYSVLQSEALTIEPRSPLETASQFETPPSPPPLPSTPNELTNDYFQFQPPLPMEPPPPQLPEYPPLEQQPYYPQHPLSSNPRQPLSPYPQQPLPPYPPTLPQEDVTFFKNRTGTSTETYDLGMRSRDGNGAENIQINVVLWIMICTVIF